MLLAITFIVSCSNDNSETVVNDDLTSVELQELSKVFEEYDKFKSDGKIIEDKDEVIQLLQNSHVTHFIPKQRLVAFFSSDEKLEQLTGANVKKLRENTPSDQNIFQPTKGNNDSKSGALLGISGLNDVATNSYFTNFSNSIFYTIEYSSNHYYHKATNSSNIASFSYVSGGNNRSVKVSSSGVTDVGTWLSTYFRDMYRGNCTITAHNDTSQRDMWIVFYENTSYNGRTSLLSLDKDQYKQISRYKFGSFSSDYPKSTKIITDDEYYSGDW